MISELEGSTKLSYALTCLGACRPAIRWSRAYGTDWIRAWRECRCPDWMAWLAAGTVVFDDSTAATHRTRLYLESARLLFEDDGLRVRDASREDVQRAREAYRRIDDEMWLIYGRIDHDFGKAAASLLNNAILDVYSYEERYVIRAAQQLVFWPLDSHIYGRTKYRDAMCDLVRDCVSEVRIHHAIEAQLTEWRALQK